MTNCVDPDQKASSEAICSGTTLFAKAMPILVQQGKVTSKIKLRYTKIKDR